MTTVKTYFFDGVIFPTDQSRAGMSAFYHALAIAAAARTHLRMLHVASTSNEERGHFPKVRDTITRWENLDHPATEEDLKELGLGVRKIKIRDADPLDKLISQIQKHIGHLLVLAPHKRVGLDEWLHKSVSTALLRETEAPCLVVGEDCSGFIDHDGKVKLEHLLLPVDSEPDCSTVIDACTELCALLDAKPKVTVLHVGQALPFKPDRFPKDWEICLRDGDPADAVSEEAAKRNTSLIGMITEGRSGLMDSIRGSVTERVVKNAPCPVLVLHA